MLILKVFNCTKIVHAGAHLIHSGVCHPPVFLSKSPQAIENKGSECGKERQEGPRVRKQKEAKEIEEATGVRLARFVRDNTANDTTDLNVCQ